MEVIQIGEKLLEDLSRGNAKTLFEHVWIHTFGIGALCATGVCDFSHEQIAEMLTQDFTAPFFDKAWRVEDPNTFGTDEYIRLCESLCFSLA